MRFNVFSPNATTKESYYFPQIFHYTLSYRYFSGHMALKEVPEVRNKIVVFNMRRLPSVFGEQLPSYLQPRLL